MVKGFFFFFTVMGIEFRTSKTLYHLSQAPGLLLFSLFFR
jgi:hypothetical protein